MRIRKSRDRGEGSKQLHVLKSPIPISLFTAQLVLGDDND